MFMCVYWSICSTVCVCVCERERKRCPKCCYFSRSTVQVFLSNLSSSCNTGWMVVTFVWRCAKGFHLPLTCVFSLHRLSPFRMACIFCSSLAFLPLFKEKILLLIIFGWKVLVGAYVYVWFACLLVCTF